MSTTGSRENNVEVANSEGGGDGGVDFFDSLPEGFIADILSMTSPRDVCRMSVVAPIFQSAAESNTVWEKFLPVDYLDTISQAVPVVDDDRLNELQSFTKKELYHYLCDNPILIDGGNKSFSLEKNSGKKCYMLAAKDLRIVRSDTPRYWRWTSLQESRFLEVAELISVCWLQMCGKIDTSMLSPNTAYAAYLVFKTTAINYGFKFQALEGSIRISGEEKKTREVYLDPVRKQNQRYTKERRDGWLEIEIGEYYNKDGFDGELEMSLTEIKTGSWKGGIIIEGIEIRPKVGKKLK